MRHSHVAYWDRIARCPHLRNTSAFETAAGGSIQHIRNTETRFRIQRDTPSGFELVIAPCYQKWAIAQFVREGTHITSALYIV